MLFAVQGYRRRRPTVRKRHTVRLSEEERARLHTLIGQGVAPARALTHARILLKANQGQAGPGWTDAAIGAALEVNPATSPGSACGMSRRGWRRRCTARRPSASTAAGWMASRRRTWPRWRAAPHPRAASAGRCGCWPIGWWSWSWWSRCRMRRSARSCSKPPQAVADPTLVHPARAGRRVLLADGGRAGVYTRPYDRCRPQVCLDETSRQLLAEVSPPRPVAPGRPARQDYEYERRGVCNLFLVCEPLAGWRDVMVSARRTRIDWAHCVKDLLEVHYPDAERIVLVQDNPEHPHPRVAVRGVCAGRGQAAGRPAGAARHPKHGSWLNMAEIELSVLADRATLEREVAAWQAARNRAGRGVDWRFTTEGARIKLRHLYPVIQA